MTHEWVMNETSIKNNESTTGTYNNGTTMEQQWNNNGTTMEQQWNNNGTTTEQQRCNNGTTTTKKQ